MIRQLRKRHVQIWILWAILLPVGIIVAWMKVPKKATQESTRIEVSNIKEDTIAHLDKVNYTINILLHRETGMDSILHYDSIMKNSSLRLEFINKRELTSPSMLLYQVIDSTQKDIDKQELLGRIDTKGSHYFPLKIESGLDKYFGGDCPFLGKYWNPCHGQVIQPSMIFPSP